MQTHDYAATFPLGLLGHLAHGDKGWLFSSEGGGWEYPLFLAAASVALVLLGSGAYALPLQRRPQAANA